MNNPFIDTILYTTVEVRPDQLNNNLYSNIKENLIKNVDKKCFKNYGYISEVYEVLSRDDGRLLAEDPRACVTYRIKFSCRLWHPLEGTQIICKVFQNSEMFVNLVRDQIHIYVTPDRINKNIFTRDTVTNKIKLLSGDALDVGMLVKVTITAKTFTDKDTRIIVLGALDDVASDKEIETYYTKSFSATNMVAYDDYIRQSTPQQIVEDNNGIVMETSTPSATNNQ